MTGTGNQLTDLTFKSHVSVWRGNVRIELESCKLLMRISGIKQKKMKPSVISLQLG